MRARRRIKHEFIELLPEIAQRDTLYISVKYKCMVHLCFCGCGRKVVTPVSPTGWEFTFDGREVSICPSIGNWNLPCRSHYWITGSRVELAEQWSNEQIAAGFARDREAKLGYYRRRNRETEPRSVEIAPSGGTRKRSIWSRLRQWIS